MIAVFEPPLSEATALQTLPLDPTFFNAFYHLFCNNGGVHVKVTFSIQYNFFLKHLFPAPMDGGTREASNAYEESLRTLRLGTAMEPSFTH